MKTGKRLKRNTMIPSEFYIYNDKSSKLFDKSLQWFINSWKFKEGSLEKKICLLKEAIYRRESLKYLKKTKRILERSLNDD